MVTSRVELLLDTARTRGRALEVLCDLQRAQVECEGHLKSLRRADALKAVTGKTALENAAAHTRRMIDSLDRILDEGRLSLTEEERTLLAEIEAECEAAAAVHG